MKKTFIGLIALLPILTVAHTTTYSVSLDIAASNCAEAEKLLTKNITKIKAHYSEKDMYVVDLERNICTDEPIRYEEYQMQQQMMPVMKKELSIRIGDVLISNTKNHEVRIIGKITLRKL